MRCQKHPSMCPTFCLTALVRSAPVHVRFQTDLTLDHLVQLVGYGGGDGDEEPYWIIRNSWTSLWGEKVGVVVESDPTCLLIVTCVLKLHCGYESRASCASVVTQMGTHRVVLISPPWTATGKFCMLPMC